MKVAMFSSWQVRCGIASYTADLVEGLRALDETDVQIVPYDRRRHPRSDYVAWGRLLNAGDVAHVQHEYTFFDYLLPWQHTFPAFVAQVRKPLVITRHVSFDGPLLIPGRGIRHLLRRLKWAAYNRWLGGYAVYLNAGLFDHAQQIIVLTQRIKDHLVARGVREAKIHVIPAGVPQVPAASVDPRLRDRWGWSDKRICGIFGYITAAKGHLLALDALAELPEEYVLLVAGGVRRAADRAVLDELRRRITELKLEQRVRITGYLADEDVAAHIRSCDLLLYPATHVDSSYSLVTGIAYRHAPLIASGVYGHTEVASRCAGLELFRSGDASALAATICAVSAAPHRRAAMLDALDRYAQEHSWLAVAQRHHAVYELARAEMV